MKIYSVKDIGSGFTQIFTANNDYNAKRILTDTVNSPQPTLMSQYPKDFSLYCLGELNQDTGIISPESETRFICEALEVKKKPETV